MPEPCRHPRPCGDAWQGRTVDAGNIGHARAGPFSVSPQRNPNMADPPPFGDCGNPQHGRPGGAGPSARSPCGGRAFRLSPRASPDSASRMRPPQGKPNLTAFSRPIQDRRRQPHGQQTKQRNRHSHMAQNASMEEFEALLNESLEIDTPTEGSVVKGKVLAIEAGQAIIDVGYKMEGRVDLKEFAQPGEAPEVEVGDEVEVYLRNVENARGEAVISHEMARREAAWDRLEEAYGKEERVEGAIFGRVKGGFTVDLGGAVAFLPGSQVDVRPVRDAGPLMGLKQPFQILKMDRRRGNIVVSRRAILEESRAEQRAEVIGNLAEGQNVDGVVKNITEYGAFVDLGGVDGLLHVTDMAWRRVNDPREILSIGETVKVQVIKINKETHRISLGMKQLQDDPWDTVIAKYPLDSTHTGRVTNITDYGAFVELEPGVEGLVHVSEMSWTKKNVHPGKIVSTSQEVEVMVLEIDTAKRRVSLGLKQTMRNPWEVFAETHPEGTQVEGEVKNITEFGLFVGLPGDIDGMVHLSDLTWEGRGEDVIGDYRKGDIVQAVVSEVDTEKERISLSIKAAGGDPYAEAIGGVKRGSIITVEVTKIEDGGIEVEYEGMKSFIRRSDLARDRADQRPERFGVGDKIDVRVTNVDSKNRRLGLSIKAREIAEEKEAVEQFGSSDSGASLGDILGAALKGDDD
ncbi:30S ribosomal protein S1 [Jannaschia sp. S6380]|uniref:30S ribosomal protein S1 n=1 Tax=Jannaschia sp. S6380 TaxID=2926408 RepID=UPI0032B185BC